MRCYCYWCNNLTRTPALALWYASGDPPGRAKFIACDKCAKFLANSNGAWACTSMRILKDSPDARTCYAQFIGQQLRGY